MAKVILITTREIDRLLQTGGVVEVGEIPNLRQQFLNTEQGEWRLFYRLFHDDDSSLADSVLRGVRFEDEEERVDYTQFAGSIVRVLDIFNDYTLCIPEEIEDEVIRMMIKKIANDYKPRSGRYSEENLGKLFCIDIGEKDTCIFLAHEFPTAFCTNTTTKANYLKALVTDIEHYLENKGMLQDLEWFFINHDNDWDDLEGQAQNIVPHAALYSIHLFQHVHYSDNIYENWIKRLDEMIEEIKSGAEIKDLLPSNSNEDGL